MIELHRVWTCDACGVEVSQPAAHSGVSSDSDLPEDTWQHLSPPVQLGTITLRHLCPTCSATFWDLKEAHEESWKTWLRGRRCMTEQPS